MALIAWLQMCAYVWECTVCVRHCYTQKTQGFQAFNPTILFLHTHSHSSTLKGCTKQESKNDIMCIFHFVYSWPHQIYLDHQRMSILCFPQPRQFFHILQPLLLTNCTMVSFWKAIAGWETHWPCPLTNWYQVDTDFSVPVASILYDISVLPSEWFSCV